MYLIRYCQDASFKIYSPSKGVLGVVNGGFDETLAIMDDIAMAAIMHSYGNPHHDEFKIQMTHAHLAKRSVQPYITFTVVYRNEKGEFYTIGYFAERVTQLN